MRVIKKILALGSAIVMLSMSAVNVLAEEMTSNAVNVANAGNYSQLPNSVDLSTSPCFPPIGNQGAAAACVAFATTYYQYSYEVNKLNNVTSVADREDGPIH